MQSAEALDALETALAGRRPDEAALTLAPMRWSALSNDVAVLSEPLFEAVDTRRGASEAASGGDLRAMVSALNEAEAVKRLSEVFREEAAAILRLPAEDVDTDRPMSELGFDSLMAVELKLTAEEKYNVSLPIFSLADGATLTSVAVRVASDLRGGAAVSTDEGSAEFLLARHVGGDVGAAAARLGAAAQLGSGEG
jgi:acyl carrier protein